MTRLPFGVACEQDKSRTAAASLPATMSSRVNTSRSHSYNIAHTFSLQDVNIDAQNNTGATAIVIAAKDGHADIVYALLERGANVSIEANEVRNTSRLFLTHPSPSLTRFLLCVNLFKMFAAYSCPLQNLSAFSKDQKTRPHAHAAPCTF
jgi:ankyrin repeat protein